MINPFSEEYKDISNSRLLEILEMKSDYLPLAIEAAERELKGRRLKPKEKEEALAILLIKKKKEEHKKEQLKKTTIFLSSGLSGFHYLILFGAFITVMTHTFFIVYTDTYTTTSIGGEIIEILIFFFIYLFKKSK